jgi:hypothetical protein
MGLCGYGQSAGSRGTIFGCGQAIGYSAEDAPPTSRPEAIAVLATLEAVLVLS